MAGLRKNSNTGILLGVCSGLSEWSKIPVHYIRIGFLVACICSLMTVGGAYVVLAGVLSDTAQCSMIAKKKFWDRFKTLFRPWWRSDFVP